MSRLYADAAKVLEKVLSREKRHRGGLKAHLFTLTGFGDEDGSKSRGKVKVYALVTETVRHMAILREVLLRAKCGNMGIKNEAMKFVVVFDYLFGKGIQGGGSVKRAVTSAGDKLKRALEAVRAAHKGDETFGIIPRAPSLPRYVRANTVKISPEEAHTALVEAGHAPTIDPHVPYVLRLPSGARIYDHPLVKSCAIILQDKSSCFPAHVLVDALSALGGSVRKDDAVEVIDACAAPGNKTSQLAAYLALSNYKNCRVRAYDKDEKRAGILKRRMAEAGCAEGIGRDLVQSFHADFLATDPEDPAFRNVRAVLLDPTCSGSGIVGRVERGIHAENNRSSGEGKNAESERIAALAEFQSRCIDHAFSFPQVDVVVYSTCSVHVEENESVVAGALARTRETSDPFGLAPRECVLPGWDRRGVECAGLSEEESARVVRADYAHDDTNGFFVSCFARERLLRAFASKRKRKEKMKQRRKKRRRGKKRKREEEEEKVF